MTAATKITYTSASGNLEEFHQRFDAALEAVRREAGRLHAFHIDDAAVETAAEPLVDRSPIDTSLVLGRFSAAGPEHVDSAVKAARRAQREWGGWPWRDRTALLRGAASLIRERKYRLAALMSLEVGKSRLEAMGDARNVDVLPVARQRLASAEPEIRATAARVVRAMMPIGIMESVTTGSSTCRRCCGFNTLKVLEPCGPIPDAGKSCSSTAKQIIRSMPSQ